MNKTSKSSPPTENQRLVWNALDEVTFLYHRVPTIRELQIFIGGMSTSTIQRLLRGGVEAGRVATWERDGNSTNYLPAWLQQVIEVACTPFPVMQAKGKFDKDRAVILMRDVDGHVLAEVIHE